MESVRLSRATSAAIRFFSILLSTATGLAPDLRAANETRSCVPPGPVAAAPCTTEPEPSPEPTPAPPPAPVATPPPRRFWVAAGEVALLELIPWTFNRYVTDQEWARISTDTVKDNFETGFVYDHDDFPVNQFGHPYHGSTFFNAARSNGYQYWASGAFALAGSLAWECCMENTPPSKNDLVNTALGGMTRGEVAHRLSAMILDNTAIGGVRFWRELGAALINPVGAFNRLVRGDMTRHQANPEERFPQGFAAAADLGYRQVSAGDVQLSQASLSLSARYGDPFAGDHAKPFDTFWGEMDLNTPGDTTLTRIEERGLLKGWDWSAAGSSSRHIFNVTQEYAYIDNEAEVFGAQMFGVGLLSRYGSGHPVFATTDVSVILIPLAGIQTIDFADPETGRTYDYAPGAGLRVGAKVLNDRGLELASIDYSQIRAWTVDGVSDESRLQFLRGSGRIHLSRRLGVGAGYWWYGRRTTYTGFTEPRSTQSEWRAFFNITVGASGMRKPT
jgi:Domain of unknown function (DUF3943)